MRPLAFLLVIGMVFAPVAGAEKITLTSGRVIEGEIIEKTDDYVKVLVDEKLMKIKFSLMDEASRERTKKFEINLQKRREFGLRSTTLTQEDFQAYVDSAMFFIKRGDHQSATEEFVKALQIEPKSYNVNLLAGTAAIRTEDYDRALSFFEAAAAVRPDDFKANYAAGMAADKAGDYPKAVRYLTAACNISPDYTPALSALARIYREVYNNPGKAQAYAQKVLDFSLADEKQYQIMSLAFKQKAYQFSAQAQAYQGSRDGKKALRYLLEGAIFSDGSLKGSFINLKSGEYAEIFSLIYDNFFNTPNLMLRNGYILRWLSWNSRSSALADGIGPRPFVFKSEGKSDQHFLKWKANLLGDLDIIYLENYCFQNDCSFR